MKKICKRIIQKFRFIRSVNWVKTIYFNFKILPWKDAVKLPVVFYGYVKFHGLNGRIIFNIPIRWNMVRFGVNLEAIRTATKTAQLTLNGDLVVTGQFDTGVDYKIIVQRDGELSIGANSYFGANVKIFVYNKVVLGKYARVGYDSQITDSDYHYIMDVETRQISRLTKGSIVLNDYCWIGNRTSIMKGTILPSKCMVTSNSLVNKNFSNVSENAVIGGMPAKLIKTGKIRIFNPQAERAIDKFFNENLDENVYILPPDVDIL